MIRQSDFPSSSGIKEWSQALPSVIPLKLKEWLIYKGSFMQRLVQFGISDAQIRVLQERWMQPWAWEKNYLDTKKQTQMYEVQMREVLIREVLIHSGEKYWMFARTVFPESILTGKYACLAHLQTRSLGSVLFKDPDLKRSEFEYIALQKSMPLY